MYLDFYNIQHISLPLFGYSGREVVSTLFDTTWFQLEALRILQLRIGSIHTTM